MPPPPEILSAPTDASEVIDTGEFMEAPFYGAEVCMEAEPPPPPDIPGIFAGLVQNWPTIEPESVITSDKFVSSSMTNPTFEETKAWITAWIQQIEHNERTSLECYDFARFQMARAGWQTTPNNWDDAGKFLNLATYYQIYTQYGGDKDARFSTPDSVTAAAARGFVDVARTEAAINYIKQALQRGEPVMSGIRLWGFGQSPNDDKTTNHFVVIVGMSRDANNRCFLSTFNSGSSSARTHDFFLQPNLMLHDETSPGVIYSATMSQIRESQRLSSEAQIPPKPTLPPATP